ncbi:hypothetical protein L2V44_14290, partial [Staphylococcus aureus]|nr:hypothetical protein [Staphylococcus aureus]
TQDCIALKNQIENLILQGYLANFVPSRAGDNRSRKPVQERLAPPTGDLRQTRGPPEQPRQAVNWPNEVRPPRGRDNRRPQTEEEDDEDLEPVVNMISEEYNVQDLISRTMEHMSVEDSFL